jgi:coenzyme F420-dependent glucose-6-phosphate dehydrogenase
MALRLGYKASAEQFGPRELLDYSVLAERLGLDSVAVSDHFQPWRHRAGRAPNALVWLGALAASTKQVVMGTSVLAPILRYHPAIVAHAFATLAQLAPGRVFLGLGTGEAVNELPVVGQWPPFRERLDRLVEAIELKRLLWEQERVTYKGKYYSVEKATVYERPEEPVPIYIAASGTRTAELAGRLADGFITTSGKNPDLYRELVAALEEGARAGGRDLATIERTIEIKLSYDHDVDYAREACRWWAALSLTPEEKMGVEDPIELERLADEKAADRAHSRFIVSNDPEEVVERVADYVELGFTHLVFHAPGGDQQRFLEQFAQDVLPRLRVRWS